MSRYFPNRWPLSYLNFTKNIETYIRRSQHKKSKHQDIKQQVAQGQRSLTQESTSTVTGQSFFFFFLVATTLKIDFSNIQGQPTLQSRVESGSNLNSSKMFWLSLLLPRMKKILSKLKPLVWPQYIILIFQTLKGN